MTRLPGVTLGLLPGTVPDAVRGDWAEGHPVRRVLVVDEAFMDAVPGEPETPAGPAGVCPGSSLSGA